MRTTLELLVPGKLYLLPSTTAVWKVDNKFNPDCHSLKVSGSERKIVMFLEYHAIFSSWIFVIIDEQTWTTYDFELEEINNAC